VLSLRYSELFVKLSHLYLAPPLGVANFAEIFGIRKLESLGYRVASFDCDPVLIQYGVWRTDRQTDRQTDSRTHDFSVYCTV